MEDRNSPQHATLPQPQYRSPVRRAAVGALLYMTAGTIWIAFSDAVLHAWIRDPRLLALAQTLKGWFFVVATGVLLFIVLQRVLRRDARLVRDHLQQRADLDALNQFRESVIDNASIWINVLDPSARVTLWNKAAEHISGYSRDEVLGHDDIWERLYPDPDYRESVTAKVIEILGEGIEVENLETRICCRDGRHKIISWNSRRFFYESGEMGSIAIGRDVTEHKQMQKMLRARDQQLAILMANVPGMVYRRRSNADWTLRFVSSGCLGLTGYTADDLIDDRAVSYASLVHPEDRERIQARTHKGSQDNQSFTLEYRILHRNGQPRWVWEQGRVVHTEDGPHLEGIIVNITDRKRMERQLEQLAVQDPLTGLHNRRELQLALEDQALRADREQQPLSLLWVDIDSFKSINDGRGHLIGDEVLRKVAHVLHDHMRAEDLAARYGGDEFVVVLPGMDSTSAMRLAETMQHALRAIQVKLPDDGILRITASIGVATLPEHASDAESLTDAADRAMYRAKRSGRDQVCYAMPTASSHESGTAGRSEGPA